METDPTPQRLRWQRARTIFDAVIELPAAQRESRLLNDCGDDAGLLAEVRTLLAAADVDPATDSLSLDRAAPDLLDELGEVARQSESGAWVGARLGAWVLQRQIGRGGMGAVYLAERADGAYRQQAAVKLIRADWDADELLRRFHDERQILAQLEHPNIARLLDGGLTAAGLPFLVMEYVQGRTILEHCDALCLGLVDRLRLFRAVCDAVSHAHRRLVVHRDIKPSNVLVSDDGSVKLLDFGVAKLIDTGSGPGLTGSRLAPLTPAYAAPEQLRGETASIQTDVYGLGLMLYQLLTGLLPHRGRSRASAEGISEVLTREPAPPSAALIALSDDPGQRAEIAARRATRPQALVRALRGDLDAVLLRALRSRAEDRYPSVEQFAADIDSLLSRRPVSARRGTRRYRLQRFVQRHRLPVALSALLFIALIAGLGHSLLQAQRIASERDRALVEQRRAAAALSFQQEIFRQANPMRHGGSEPSASELLRIGERTLDEQPDMEPSVRAMLLEEFAGSHLGIGNLDASHALYLRALHAYDELGNRLAALRVKLALATIEQNRGMLESAEQRLVAALDDPEVERLEPLQHARALYLRGILRGNRGSLDSAAEDLIASAQRRFSINGFVDTNYLVAVSTAAHYLGNARRFEDAEALLDASRALWLQHPAPSGEGELALAGGFSSLLLASHQFERARPHVQRRLEITLRVYGEDHPQSTYVYQNLAMLARHDEDLPAALEWQQRTLDIRLRRVGEGAGSTLAARLAMAQTLLRMDRLDEADTQVRLAIDGLRALDGEHSVAVQRARAWQAHVLEASGQFAQAASLADELLGLESAGADVLEANTRARLSAMRAAYGPVELKFASRCHAIEALGSELIEAEQPMLRLYRIDCLRRLGFSDEARALLDSMTPEARARLNAEPSLRRMIEAVGGRASDGSN